jgi:predicted CxxxxCH...CXXCH cytochrome family protein
MTASIGGIRCHSSSPATNPTGCISCHGKPPTGTTSPNTDNAHTEHHNFFATAEAACQACHNGHGMSFTTQIGTATHANGTANVVIIAAYKAEPAGTPAITAGKTCTNISCHGGQTTPAWNETNASNLINVNTDCVKCHIFGTTQYNSYFSGEHDKHVREKGIGCTSCHNTITLSVNHFTRLDTPAMEGPASATIGGGTTLIPAGNWNPSAKTCIAPTSGCHDSNEAEDWID